VCELWGYLHPSLEAGRERPLPLQRLRPLLQDEWHQSAARQAQKKTGKQNFCPLIYSITNSVTLKNNNDLFSEYETQIL
jgi:hypothetical protein